MKTAGEWVELFEVQRGGRLFDNDRYRLAEIFAAAQAEAIEAAARVLEDHAGDGLSMGDLAAELRALAKKGA
jgi:hypothetical protein